MAEVRYVINKSCVCGKILAYTYYKHKSALGTLCIRIEVRHDDDFVASILAAYPRAEVEDFDDEDTERCAVLLKERIAEDLYNRDAICAGVWLES